MQVWLTVRALFVCLFVLMTPPTEGQKRYKRGDLEIAAHSSSCFPNVPPALGELGPGLALSVRG